MQSGEENQKKELVYLKSENERLKEQLRIMKERENSKQNNLEAHQERRTTRKKSSIDKDLISNLKLFQKSQTMTRKVKQNNF